MTAGLVFYWGLCVPLPPAGLRPAPVSALHAGAGLFYCLCVPLPPAGLRPAPVSALRAGAGLFIACAYLYRRGTEGATARLLVLAFLQMEGQRSPEVGGTSGLLVRGYGREDASWLPSAEGSCPAGAEG